MDRLDEYGKIKTMSTMEKIRELYTQLINNVETIDQINNNIVKLEIDLQDIDQLELLYEREFMLLMNNISIYEDLINLIDNEKKTSENEFELARIRRDAMKHRKVEVVEF